MAILGKSEIKFHVQSQFNLKNSQAGKRDLSPLLRLRFTNTGVKERSGDKSLFPTSDFLMFGEKNRFLPTKSAAIVGLFNRAWPTRADVWPAPTATLYPTTQY